MANSLEHLLSVPIPPTKYHVFPLIPVKGVLIIGAQPKSYKSFLALNMAYDMSEGQPVLGRWSCDDKPKTVLLLEQELGEWRLKERLNSVHRYREGKLAPQNLYYASKDLSCNLDTSPGILKIKEHIESCHPDIVIYDPFIWFHNKDENDNTEMHGLMKEIFKLNEEYGHSSIVIHHMGKPGENRTGDDPTSLRGGSSIYGAVDTVVTIGKPVQNDQTHLRLKFSLRSAENPFPMDIRLDNNTMTFKEI